MIAPADSGPFPRSRRGKGQGGALGPSSNTGQKCQGAIGAVVIDWLTVVISRTTAANAEVHGLTQLLDHLFPGAPLSLASSTGRPRNFYPDHAPILFQDEDGGQLAGFIAFSDDACCVTLSGVGCSAVRDFAESADRLEMVEARITRCDIAYDDFHGRTVQPAAIRDMWLAGAFNSNGRPPKGRFIDDHGSDKGCTAYVGTKGYMELCAYDKGKQIGDTASQWTRLEGRFYAKHRELPLSMLERPGAFLRGMYAVFNVLLAEVIEAAGERCESIKQTAIATAKTMTTWLHRQCGKALGMLRAAMPDETEFAQAMGVLSRKGRPVKFRIPTSAAELHNHLRTTCHVTR